MTNPSSTRKTGSVTRLADAPAGGRSPSRRPAKIIVVDHRLDDRLTFYAKPRLLICDELGYLPFEAHAAHLFFQLVSRRYERGSILITSNRSVGEWGEVFGDAVVATAILDRLLHHSHVLTITGESFRLREKRRAGVLKLSAPTPDNQPRKRT